MTGQGARNISVKKWEIYYFKIKFIPLIINLRLVRTSSDPKPGRHYQKNLPYSTNVQWDISDLPCVQTLGLSILSNASKYLEVELKASIISV